MEGVINRLRSTVSGALPGNPLCREFDLGSQIASSGPGLSWKLYCATKKSCKEPATVWMFEKRLLDRYSKTQKEIFLDRLRQGVSSLTRLRHPRILSVVHPLEDSRDSLGFATEPIFASLANALGRRENLNSSASEKLSDFKFTDTEVKYGILQICEALLFIHRDGHQLHLNVCPEAVVINRLGSWKLCGFEFAQPFLLDRQRSSDGPNRDSINVPVWQSTVLPLCQPNLDYSSPEVIIDGFASPGSDMFSVGMLIFALYNNGTSMLNCHESYATYRQGVNQLKSLKQSYLNKLPEAIQSYMKMLLHPDVSVRLDAHELLKLDFFEDPNIASLKSLDDLYQLDNLGRSRFYKNLPSSIKHLPKRINLHRVFPQLAEEFSNNNMIPFLLPSILQIIDMVSKEEFTTYILPKFSKVLLMREPVQILLVLLQNLNILVAKISSADFKTHALPFLASALETNATSIVELCLKGLPEVAELMDYTILKTTIVPRLKKVFLQNELVSIRLDSLICLGKLLEYLDKWCVMDDVLAFLAEIKLREPAILVAVLTIYKIAFSHKKLGISRDFLASRVLPHLLVVSLDTNLSVAQYSAFAELIRQMISQLETEQKVKLTELHGLRDEAQHIPALASMPFNTSGKCADVVDQMMFTIGGVMRPSERTTTVASAPTIVNPDVDWFATPRPSADEKTRSLTLEDKKRLLAQSEAQIRHIPQAQLMPTTASLPQHPKPTVDITDQLINSNLAAVGPACQTLSQSDFSFTSQQPAFNRPVKNFGSQPQTINSVGAIGSFVFSRPAFGITNELTPLTVSLTNQVPVLKHPPTMVPNIARKQLSKSEIDDLLS